MLAAILGGAARPWVSGTLHDLTGSYSLAFWLSRSLVVLSRLSRYGGLRLAGVAVFSPRAVNITDPINC
jgi:cyanate permease